MPLSASPNSQKKHSSSWWPFGAKKDLEEEELLKRESSGTAAILNTASPDSVQLPVAEDSLKALPEELLEVEVEEEVEEPASKVVTRYSVGTQTTFLEEKVLNLVGDDNEPEPGQSRSKEKFRKTLRLSSEAIVSCITY
jgi:hypothetical protein